MKNTETAKQESTKDYNLENIEPFRPRPHFEIDNRGVWWVNVRTNKDGDVIEAEPLFLSDPIDIIGTGQDNDGSYYRIIKFKDKITRRQKTAALPQAEIGTVQGWQRLQSYGLTIMNGRIKREKLADYLQEQGSQLLLLPTAPAGTGKPTYWQAGKPLMQTAQTFYTTETPAKKTVTQKKAASRNGRNRPRDTQRTIAVYA